MSKLLHETRNVNLWAFIGIFLLFGRDGSPRRQIRTPKVAVLCGKPRTKKFRRLAAAQQRYKRIHTLSSHRISRNYGRLKHAGPIAVVFSLLPIAPIHPYDRTSLIPLSNFPSQRCIRNNTGRYAMKHRIASHRLCYRRSNLPLAWSVGHDS